MTFLKSRRQLFCRLSQFGDIGCFLRNRFWLCIFGRDTTAIINICLTPSSPLVLFLYFLFFLHITNMSWRYVCAYVKSSDHLLKDSCYITLSTPPFASILLVTFSCQGFIPTLLEQSRSRFQFPTLWVWSRKGWRRVAPKVPGLPLSPLPLRRAFCCPEITLDRDRNRAGLLLQTSWLHDRHCLSLGNVRDGK